MSTDDQEEKKEQPTVVVRPRKIAKSASTAERPGFTPTEAAPEGAAPAGGGGGEGDGAAPASAGEASGGAPGGPRSERRWDVRRERAPGSAGPARPPRRRPGGPGARPEGAFEPGRRPGASGGRASPEIPWRPNADRSAPEFVDRWLSQKPRPRPEGRPDRPFGERGPGREGGRGDRPRLDARPGGAPRGPGRPGERPASPQPPPSRPRPEEKKVPTLSETILLGLPKVALEGQRDKSANKPKTAKEALLAKTASAPKRDAERAAPKAGEKKAAVELKDTWLKASGEGAVAALREAGDAGEKLVDAWTQSNNAAAIVEAANDESGPAAARKAARRALGVLRARNVTIPERAQAKPAASRDDEEVTEATFSPPDGRGTSSFIITKRKGGERAHIVEVIMRDEVGLIHAGSGYMSRSQIKEAHQRAADSTGIPPIAVPVEWARARIASAKKQNATSNVLVPLGLDKCKDLLEPIPEAEPPHPIADLESGLEAAPAEEATASIGLHNEPEFRPWVPDSRSLEELVRKVGASMTGEEAKDPAKVDDVVQTEMKAATDRFFTPEMRTGVASRMRDAALSIRSRAGEEKAKEVLRIALAVEKAGLITSPPHEVGFLYAFFQKGVAMLAQQSGGQLRVPTRA